MYLNIQSHSVACIKNAEVPNIQESRRFVDIPPSQALSKQLRVLSALFMRSRVWAISSTVYIGANSPLSWISD